MITQEQLEELRESGLDQLQSIKAIKGEKFMHFTLALMYMRQIVQQNVDLMVRLIDMNGMDEEELADRKKAIVLLMTSLNAVIADEMGIGNEAMDECMKWADTILYGTFERLERFIKE